MTKPVKLRVVTKILQQNGWFPIRQAGSHQTWAHCTCGESGDSSGESSDDSDAAAPSTPAPTPTRRRVPRATIPPSPAKRAAGGFPMSPRVKGLRIDTAVAANSTPSALSSARPSPRKRAQDDAACLLPPPSKAGGLRRHATISYRERRRPQVHASSDDGVEHGAPSPVRAVTPLLACSCHLREFGAAGSPIKGMRAFGQLATDGQRRLTRDGDRITIVNREPVDPKCIMQLKRMLADVPPEW